MNLPLFLCYFIRYFPAVLPNHDVKFQENSIVFQLVSKQTYKLFWRNWYPFNTNLLLSSVSRMLYFLDSKTPPLMSHIINLIYFCKNQNKMLCYIQNVIVLLNPFDPWIVIRVAGPSLALLPSLSSEEIYLSHMFASFEVKHASGLVDAAT